MFPVSFNEDVPLVHPSTNANLSWRKSMGKSCLAAYVDLTSQALPLPPLVQPSDQVCLFVCACVSL